jgi:hypothetical protein
MERFMPHQALDAVDVRVVDVSNTAFKAIYTNGALNSLNQVGAEWGHLQEINPFVVPNAEVEEIRNEVAFVLKQLLTKAGFSQIELQSDPKKGLSATVWRSGDLYGTMLIVPGDWDGWKMWSKVDLFYCKPCMGGGGDYLNSFNERVVNGVLIDVLVNNERVPIYFDIFSRDGDGAYLVSVAGPLKAKKEVDGADKKLPLVKNIQGRVLGPEVCRACDIA